MQGVHEPVVSRGRETWKKWSSLPRSVWVPAVVFPAVSFLTGCVLGPVSTIENTRFLLSALAGAQSGLLAIVFSVTVIGIQLVSTRYSPRMATQFTRAPIFVFTFLLFVLSVAVDLFLLYALPPRPTAIYTASVFGASGLALVTVYTLFIFVREAIVQSTPDGAIDAFVSETTTDSYLRRVRKTVSDDSEYAHPMRPLYTLILSALSNGEQATVRKGMHEYGETCKNVLNEFRERDTFESEAHDVTRELFKPVLEDHLREIAIQAEEHGDNSSISDATELLYELGYAGLEIDGSGVTVQAQRGLGKTIRHSGTDSGSFVASNSAWKKLGELLVKSASHPAPDSCRRICSTIDAELHQQLWTVSDVRWYESSMRQMYSSLKKAQRKLLAHYSPVIADSDVQWHPETVPEDEDDRVMAVRKWREALFDTTGQFVMYAEREDRYPIVTGNYRHTWRDICLTAIEFEYREYAVSLCQALIELALLDNEIDTDDSLSLPRMLAEVKQKGDADIVDDAFSKFDDYEYERDADVLSPENMDSWHRTYYSNQITTSDYYPLNTIQGFPEKIERLREDVDEQWRYLVQREAEYE
jgi:hypothetical protein